MTESTKSQKQTLDQRRASHAWQTVESVKAQYRTDQDKAKKFGGQARKLPTRIIASGLGQALAFLKAKNSAPELLLALSVWVLFERNAEKPPSNPGDDALLQSVIHGDSDFLRQATDEALAYLLWLNRFAEAAGLTKDAE